MEKKVIFLDIDGTLTEPGKNVPPASALTAIRRAQECGHQVWLCSGRNLGMISPLLGYSFDGVIASSGGYILAGDEVIYDCPIPEKEKDDAMRILQEKGIFRTIEGRDDSYTDEGLKDFLRSHASEGANSEFLRWREQVESALNILPMSQYKGEAAYKIVVMSDSMEKMQSLKRELPDMFQVCIQEPDGFGFVNGELVNKAFDKGRAVERVCDYLGLSVSASIGFGDSMNDLEMIEKVGYSVCMANGAKALKEIADLVCPLGHRGWYVSGF